MTIRVLRILPPFAFARLGSASEPQYNYTLQVNESDPLGFRRVVPADTLFVATDGKLTIRRADQIGGELGNLNKLFRDGPRIRPVAPFFELWAITDENEDELTPLTLDLLDKHGLDIGSIEWRVRVENRKVFRRTGNENDIVTAETAWFSDHVRQPLSGKCNHFLNGKTIEFGFVQFVEPNKSDHICSQIRLRFTPAPGRIYGPVDSPRVRDIQRDEPFITPIYKPSLSAADRELGRVDWTQYGSKYPGTQRKNSTETWPRETLPSSLYAIEPPAPPWLNHDIARSRGYFDDTCDGFIEVRTTGHNALEAKARISAGPPDFVPDSGFVRTLADDLDQVVNGPTAHDLDAAEVHRRALDIVRRAYETVRFMNVAVMNGNDIDGRPAAEFDTMPAEESFATERPIRPVMSPGSVDTAAILALHQQVFAALSAGAAAWFPRLLRKPEEVGDLTDAGRRKMPALMSGADSLYLALTRRQIDTIEKAAELGMLGATGNPAENVGNKPLLSPRNLTAQLNYTAAGNPVNSRPEMAIANCCPGLEVDFRAIWRRLFEGIELSEHDNYVVDDKRVDADGKPVEPSLKGHRLLRVGGGKDGKITAGSPGKSVTVTLRVPASSDPRIDMAALSERNPHGVWTMEWSNCLAQVLDALRKHGRTEVDCAFTTEAAEEHPPPQTKAAWEIELLGDTPGVVKLRVRDFFDRDTAVISEDLAKAGELTQGLCSPWQNDLRECSCYYWASSRPDFINTYIGDDGLTHGDNWFAKNRTGEYVPDDYVDPRLIGYDDLFQNWEQLQFQIGGEDSAPDLLNSSAEPRQRKP